MKRFVKIPLGEFSDVPSLKTYLNETALSAFAVNFTVPDPSPFGASAVFPIISAVT
ncbi:hypothetical protein D3C86_2206020 [compost metagenome]